MLHVQVKVLDLIRQQKGVWHELVLLREESLESADYNAENIFLCKMIHEWVSINNGLSHSYQINVMISQSHTIPVYVAFTAHCTLPKTILVNYVLYSIYFSSTMTSIYHNLFAFTFGKLCWDHHGYLLLVLRCSTLCLLL